MKRFNQAQLPNNFTLRTDNLHQLHVCLLVLHMQRRSTDYSLIVYPVGHCDNTTRVSREFCKINFRGVVGLTLGYNRAGTYTTLGLILPVLQLEIYPRKEGLVVQGPGFSRERSSGTSTMCMRKMVLQAVMPQRDVSHLATK